MAIKKSKKSIRSPDDEETLRSDVASFASSLGLASSVPSAGFDDSDFRKKGSMKPSRPLKNPTVSPPTTKSPATSNAAKPKKSPFDNMDPLGDKTGSNSKQPKRPLVSPMALSAQWYVDADDLEMKVLGKERGSVKALGMVELTGLVAKKKDLAEQLLQQYTQEYHFGRKKNRDLVMVENAVRSGTTADKVSALTCLVEDNPIANLKAFDTLLHMVTTKVGKRYAFSSFDALKELFLMRLLPDRKLKTLLQRPLDILPESKDGSSLLLFWYWEENLKKRYEQFVIALEDASKDMLPSLKDRALKMLYALLRGKSEQERKLLSALVNKLGDPVRTSASTAGYLLSCLLSAHPNMKAVVIDEVDSFIFRPHLGLRPKYHAVNFLSQILLTKKGDGPKHAKRLVDIYFALFKVLILGGSDNPKVHKNKKHGQNFDKRKKKMTRNAKANVFSKKNGEQSSGSDFEMDSRLLSALLTGVNRAFPYVSSDEIDDLVEVQTPILFKLVYSKNFNVGVQALMLLYQISTKNQIASDRFYRALYSKLLVPNAMNSSKPEMFLGLIVRAMKNDINIKRIAAFAKRILQVSLQQPSQYACGCLFLLSEVLKARPSLWNLMLQSESVDDDVEHFADIVEDPQNLDRTATSNKMQNPVVDECGLSTSLEVKDLLPLASGEVCNSGGDNLHREQNLSPTDTYTLPAGYNPKHREPSYCNADHAGWWELSILAAHAHPSVATMARTLLSGVNIVYNGDPLSDLSLIAFLDKFMEKKPKSHKRADGTWHGGSQIAPPKKMDMNDHLIGNQIIQLAEEDVAPEDVIFHKFYMNKSNSSLKKKKKKKTSEDVDEPLLADDGDGGDDESDNEEIDNMLGMDADEDEEGKEYDYDDLDKIDDDNDELFGNDSDEEMDPIADDDMQEDYEVDHSLEVKGKDDTDDDNEEDFVFDGDKQLIHDTNKKRKSKVSPFASAEDYAHLIENEESETKKQKLGNMREKPKKKLQDSVNRKTKKRKSKKLDTIDF